MFASLVTGGHGVRYSSNDTFCTYMRNSVGTFPAGAFAHLSVLYSLIGRKVLSIMSPCVTFGLLLLRSWHLS